MTPTPPKPDSPPFLLRSLLAAAVAAFSLWNLGSYAFVVIALFLLGLVLMTSVELEPTGVLKDPSAYHVAHWIAVGTIVLFIAGAFVRWLVLRRKKDESAISAFLVAAGALAVVSLLLRQMPGLGFVPAAVTLIDLYFFALLVPFVIVRFGAQVTWRLYRWSAETRSRAAVVALLLVLGLGSTLVGRVTGNARVKATKDATKTVTESIHAKNFVDAEREGFEAITQLLGLAVASGPKTVDSPRPVCSANPTSPTPSASADAPTTTDVGDDGDVNRCLEDLFKSAVPGLEKAIARDYRLSSADAHDLVTDALLNVCIRAKTYESREGALRVAAKRRANTNWRRAKLIECGRDVDTHECQAGVPDLERAEQMDRILTHLQCREDEKTRTVVDLFLKEGLSFVEIDAALGLEKDGARKRFNNMVKRARVRLAKDCGPL